MPTGQGRRPVRGRTAAAPAQHRCQERSGAGEPDDVPGVGEEFAVFASKAGAPTNPDWYHNLKAHPEARVEIGTDTSDVMARVRRRPEREPIWEGRRPGMPASPTTSSGRPWGTPWSCCWSGSARGRAGPPPARRRQGPGPRSRRCRCRRPPLRAGAGRGAEVGDGHPRRPPSRGLHLHPRGPAGQQPGCGHTPPRRRRRAPTARRLGGALARRFRPVPGQAGQQQVVGQPAEAVHPGAHRRGRPRLEGDVQPDHGHGPPRGEHDRRCLGIGGDVEFGGRRYVPRPAEPPMITKSLT